MEVLQHLFFSELQNTESRQSGKLAAVLSN